MATGVVWAVVVNDVAGIVTASVFAVSAGVFSLLLHRQLDNRRFFDAEFGCYWSTRGAGDQTTPTPRRSPRSCACPCGSSRA
jgi:hypothetical protein